MADTPDIIPPATEPTGTAADTTKPDETLDTPPAETAEPAPESTEARGEEEPSAQEDEPGRLGGFFKSLESKIDGSGFMKKLRGERLGSEDTKEDPSTTESAKFWTKTGISVLATIGGYKGAWDGPAWLYQTLSTNPAERERLKAVLENQVTQTPEASALKLKHEQIEAAVDASKFLSAEKKAELKIKLKEVMTDQDTELADLDETRNEEIALLLQEYVTTRVKGTVALKESVNTALHLAADASGMGVFLRLGRTGTYAAVSAYERWQAVGEREGAEELGGHMKEFMKGFQETGAKLWGKGETKKERLINRVQAAGTIGRFVGLGLLGNQAAGELMPEAGSPEATTMIDKLLDGLFEEEAPTQATQDVLATPEDSGLDTAVTGAVDPQPTIEASTTNPVDQISTETHVPTTESTIEATKEAAVEAADEAIEFEQTQIELGTVRSGDGVLRALERQLEANPADFGYEGDPADTSAIDAWAKGEGLKAARDMGLVRAGGDTRLTGEAIKNLAVMAMAKEGGGIEIVFLDNETGEQLSVEDLRDPTKGLSYEHGAVPGEIPTETDVLARSIESSRDSLSSTTESPEAPEELAELMSMEDVPFDELSPEIQEQIGTMIDTEALKEFVERGIESDLSRIQLLSERTAATSMILDRLEKMGEGDSPEAQMLRYYLADTLESIDRVSYNADYFNNEALLHAREQVSDLNDELYVPRDAMVGDNVPELRVRGLGKIEFSYSSSGHPSLDIDALIDKGGRLLEKESSGLLLENWEETLAADSTELYDKYARDIAQKLFVEQQALQQLIDADQGESPEADYLRELMRHDLSTYAPLLDQTSPVIQAASRELGIEVSAPPVPAEVAPAVEVPAEPVRAAEAISESYGLTEAPADVDGAPLETPPQTSPSAQIETNVFGNGQFKSSAGAKFVFKERSDGSMDVILKRDSITAVFGRPEIEKEALADLGTSRKDVFADYAHSAGGLRPRVDGVYLPRPETPYVGTDSSRLSSTGEAQAERYIDRVTRLFAQEQALKEMAAAGLADTREYEALSAKTGELRAFMEEKYD